MRSSRVEGSEFFNSREVDISFLGIISLFALRVVLY